MKWEGSVGFCNLNVYFQRHTSSSKAILCSMNIKNLKTEIRVQPENQKSKATKPLKKSYLYQGWATTD